MTDDDVQRLREDLQGWTVDAVEDLLGPTASAALAREQAAPALRVAAEREDEPHATLLKAFVLGRPVRAKRLAEALPALGIEGAERLGLVRVEGEEARAVVEVRPHAAHDAKGTADWWVVSDLGDPVTGAPLRADHVLGVGGASLTLAHCTVRTPVGRVLDLGTGCGVQALYAARHSRRIVATDTSERALQLTRLAWGLNQDTVDGVPLDLRSGNLLEPVEGEEFDLVVSNPPFVITPRAARATSFEYRDARLVGDELVSRLVGGIGARLAPGGVAQLLGNWEVRRGERWDERVGTWPAAGLDAWVIQRELLDPAQYAELWMRDAGQHVGPDAEALYDAWLADFAARGVEAVGFGLITLRRGSGPRLDRFEERHDAPSLPAGHEIAAALAVHDFLGAGDDALLASAPVVAPDVTEERHHVPGEEDPRYILLRSAGRAVPASTALAALVGACDGDLTITQIVGALGVLLDRPAEDLRAELLPSVRELLLDDLLTLRA